MNTSLPLATETTIIYVYDNTFEGLLTAVFEGYVQKHWQAQIMTDIEYTPQLFALKYIVETNADKASRVWKGLLAKMEKSERSLLVKCFLSELPQREEIIYQYIQYALRSHQNIARDYGNKYVLELAQIVKMVGREIGRAHV